MVLHSLSTCTKYRDKGSSQNWNLALGESCQFVELGKFLVLPLNRKLPRTNLEYDLNATMSLIKILSNIKLYLFVPMQHLTPHFAAFQ